MCSQCTYYKHPLSLSPSLPQRQIELSKCISNTSMVGMNIVSLSDVGSSSSIALERKSKYIQLFITSIIIADKKNSP